VWPITACAQVLVLLLRVAKVLADIARDLGARVLSAG
jgi:hypothetical protein